MLRKARLFNEQHKANIRATRKLIKEVNLSDEEMLEYLDLYESWEPDISVTLGEHYKYEGNLYEVITAHTTQADWLPSESKALFKRIVPEGVIPEFVLPTGGHDAYNTGDKVTFEGSVYESLIDNNTWSPTGHPQGWKLIE